MYTFYQCEELLVSDVLNISFFHKMCFLETFKKHCLQYSYRMYRTVYLRLTGIHHQDKKAEATETLTYLLWRKETDLYTFKS